MNMPGSRFLALAVLLPIHAATAHASFDGAGTFYGGVLHPLLVPAHALAILGTGLLVGQQASRWRWRAPASYVAGLGAGFAVPFAPTWALEILLAATAASGALVALARPLPQLVGCLLAFTTGFTVALDSAPGFVWVGETTVNFFGVFCGAALLLLAAAELTTMLCRKWQRLGVRILGSWIAASAVMVLTLRLAR